MGFALATVNYSYLTVGDRLTYCERKTFRQGWLALLEKPEVREIRVDFTETLYIDSAALGMLLMLNSEAMKSGKTVTLCNPRGTVREILEIAHFNTLFKVL